MKLLQIQPLDPIMTRDGRPFGDTPGATAHSMDEISPSVIAGTIRTWIGKQLSNASNNREVFKAKAKRLSQLMIRGPLYQWKGKLYFPIPKDIDFQESEIGLTVKALRPRMLADSHGFLGTGRNGLFDDLLWPIAMDKPTKAPAGLPAFISEEMMMDWLCDCSKIESWVQALAQFMQIHTVERNPSQQLEVDSPFLPAFARDVRTHTAIDSESSTVRDQALFTTEALVFPHDLQLLVSVDTSQTEIDWPRELSSVHSLGGKRRLAHFSEKSNGLHWQCPQRITDILEQASFIRMILVTPAYFGKGWIPNWLDDNLQTTDAFDPEIRLQLRWANISRWQPVSGWSYSKQEEKSIRRMVPAGSVYFFEILHGNPRHLAEKYWLKSVADAHRRKGAFDQEDGFGLALWGAWKPE